MGDKQPAVYILASDRNGTLYVGVTSDLVTRIWQHRNDVAEGFSRKYATHMLVYFELHVSMEEAILREKRLKKWERGWTLIGGICMRRFSMARSSGAGFPLSRE